MVGYNQPNLVFEGFDLGVASSTPLPRCKKFSSPRADHDGTTRKPRALASWMERCFCQKHRKQHKMFGHIGKRGALCWCLLLLLLLSLLLLLFLTFKSLIYRVFGSLLEAKMPTSRTSNRRTMFLCWNFLSNETWLFLCGRKEGQNHV